MHISQMSLCYYWSLRFQSVSDNWSQEKCSALNVPWKMSSQLQDPRVPLMSVWIHVVSPPTGLFLGVGQNPENPKEIHMSMRSLRETPHGPELSSDSSRGFWICKLSEGPVTKISFSFALKPHYEEEKKLVFQKSPPKPFILNYDSTYFF